MLFADPSDVSRLRYDSFGDEIVFQVETSEESGVLIASWDAPAGQGGITTQGRDLRELQEQVTDAVRCHFDIPKATSRFRLIFFLG